MRRITKPRSLERQTRDIHELVNMARMQQGRDPIEFPTGERREVDAESRRVARDKQLGERLGTLSPNGLPHQVIAERLRRGLRTHQVAKEIGISASVLGYIESIPAGTQFTAVPIVKYGEKIRTWLAQSKLK